MLSWLVQAAVIIGAIVLGFLLGSSPVAEWMPDIRNWAEMAWIRQRAARAGGGTIPILVAGFLLGQGLYLTIRRLRFLSDAFESSYLEYIASWDRSTKLGSRFGLNLYMGECVRWASEDPSSRTQSLGLVKIHGLGRLNEVKGTAFGTRLLRHFAREVRVASMPDSAGALRRWLNKWFPRLPLRTKRSPAPRYPARWGGATFALGFRELDAVKVTLLLRDLASWMRNEIDSMALSDLLTVEGIVVIGGAGTAGPCFGKVASEGLSRQGTAELTILMEPSDRRGDLIEQVKDVNVVRLQFPSRAEARYPGPLRLRGIREWVRVWSPGLVCVCGAVLILGATNKRESPPRRFPWPDALKELPILDQSGPITVRLLRSPLELPQRSPNWSIESGIMLQTSEPSHREVQIRLTVRNRASVKYYLSPFDFFMLDRSGGKRSMDAVRTAGTRGGLSGKWLAPGESWTGWLVTLRDAPLAAGIRFEPDRATQLDAMDEQLRLESHPPGG